MARPAALAVAAFSVPGALLAESPDWRLGWLVANAFVVLALGLPVVADAVTWLGGRRRRHG